MNALAQSDLRDAYQMIKSVKENDRQGVVVHVGFLAEAAEKLCRVCQALSEESERANADAQEREIADLKLRVYKLEKALKCHTGTQDTHNF